MIGNDSLKRTDICPFHMVPEMKTIQFVWIHKYEWGKYLGNMTEFCWCLNSFKDFNLKVNFQVFQWGCLSTVCQLKVKL